MQSEKAKRKERRIAIVGAGIAGLSAAWYLKKNGYKNVTLFEKEDRPGGKIVSYNVDGKQHDVSAILLMANYKEVFQLADAVGATYSAGITLNRYQRDLNGGQYLMGRQSMKHTGYSKAETVVSGARYFFRSLLKYRKFSSPSNGLLHPPAELKQSTETFLRQYGFQPLIGAFSYGMTSLGYGRLDHIPATYLTKYIDWRSLVSVASTLLLPGKIWPKTFDDGFQDFVEKIHDQCVDMGVDVRLGQSVDKIERKLKDDSYDTEIAVTSSKSVVGAWRPGYNHATNEKDKEPEPFDEIIISLPLDGIALANIKIDLSDAERSVFEAVYSQRFYALTCRTKNLPSGVVAVMPPPSRKHFSLYVQQQPETGITTFYIPKHFIEPVDDDKAYGGKRYGPAEGEIDDFGFDSEPADSSDDAYGGDNKEDRMKAAFLTVVKDQLATMPEYEGGKPEVVDEEEFLRVEEWAYFPRADLSSHAHEMHEFVESMQGKDNTYYNSSFMSMEICGTTVAYCKKLIDEQFPA